MQMREERLYGRTRVLQKPTAVPDISVDDLESDGGRLNPSQQLRPGVCPPGFRLDKKRNRCVPATRRRKLDVCFTIENGSARYLEGDASIVVADLKAAAVSFAIIRERGHSNFAAKAAGTHEDVVRRARKAVEAQDDVSFRTIVGRSIGETDAGTVYKALVAFDLGAQPVDRGIRYVVGALKTDGWPSLVDVVMQKGRGWDADRAIEWAAGRGLKADVATETDAAIRVPQRELEQFAEGSYVVVNPDDPADEHLLARMIQKAAPRAPQSHATKAEGTRAHVQKLDDEKQIVYGEVYAPNVPDAQGDFMSADEIEQMAHSFMRLRRQKRVDENHDNEETGAVIVESYIAREDDEIFLPGSWVVGVHIPKAEDWAKVKSGELNGFSMEAFLTKTKRRVIVELDDTLRGTTGPGQDGHTHEFEIRFETDGRFLGGGTNTVDGHWHNIEGNTITGAEVREDGESGDGHTHRYSFVEFLNIVPDVG